MNRIIKTIKLDAMKIYFYDNGDVTFLLDGHYVLSAVLQHGNNTTVAIKPDKVE